MPHRQFPMPVPDDGQLATAAPVFADHRVQGFSALGGFLIYRADLATGVIEWTPGLLWGWGYLPEDIEPCVAWWLARTHPDDVATVTRFLQEALEGKRTEWTLHYRMQRADGSWAHVEGRARLLRAPDGRPISTEGVVRDVSEQREAEAALREREVMFRLLTEQSRELICRRDADGRYLYVSPAIVELAGWTPEQLVGRNAYEYLHPDDVDRIRAEAHALALRGEVARTGIQYRFRRADGSYLWLETLTRPITDDTGAVVELHTSSRNVTERRLLEEQLARAQKLEAIGMLAGGVAHDFNNLMTIVRGNIELVRDVVVDAEAGELLTEALEATQRAASLTRQLLILGRRNLEQRVPVDLSAAVRGMSGLLTRLAGADVRVRIDAAAPCWVDGDHTTLEQVLLNVVSNARDAIQGAGSIDIAVGPVTLASAHHATLGTVPAGTWVRLAVADTGEGMSPDVLAHALEPFFTTKDQGRGTGLGLPTVLAAVQRLDGHLTVDSQPGRGTTVACWLPPVPTPTASSAPPEEPSSSRPDDGQAPLVLVVDDEPSVRSVARRALEKHGFLVKTAEDGSDALALLEGGLRPHLILTDVMMPRMSGPALAEAVLARDPTMPVVFMSGFAREELLQDGMLGHDHPLVHKPFTLNDLLAAVQGALATARGPALGTDTAIFRPA
jgi:PAS domain S-box-containing protein